MNVNFRTEEEKDEIARKYLERRKEKKTRVREKKWFPGPACKVTKQDPEQVKSGPDFSAIATLKSTEEWHKEDTSVVEACTVRWVEECFEEQTELRVAKVPYLHGVLWQNHAVSRDGQNPLMLSDHTGQIEVRLHEDIRARYRKVSAQNKLEPAILMKRLTIFKSDDGSDFYAACSLQNFIHLVGAEKQDGDEIQSEVDQSQTVDLASASDPNDFPFPSSFSLQYGAESLSQVDLSQTVDLASASAATQNLYPTSEEEESLTQSVLLPRHGYRHSGPI